MLNMNVVANKSSDKLDFITFVRFINNEYKSKF